MSHAPESGQPAEAFLDRWLRVSADCQILAGPRFLGRDPNKPFAGITASDRPLLAADRDDIAAVVGEAFVGFSPGFVMVMTADPAGAWPQTRQELRQVVGLLGDLRTQDIPEELSSRPRRDTDFYDRYAQIHAEHIEQDPTHAGHTRVEERQDLQQLADDGRLFDVLVDKEWAGIVAGESDVRRGVRGATVIELILDHQFRGKGYGRHLSSLLARALPLPDDECLMGDHPPGQHRVVSVGSGGRTRRRRRRDRHPPVIKSVRRPQQRPVRR